MRERLTKWNGNRWILPQGRTSDGESYWRIIADRLAEYENKEFGEEGEENGKDDATENLRTGL